VAEGILDHAAECMPPNEQERLIMPESPQRKARFQRANYVVTDLQRSFRLYRDILGMDVAFIQD